MTAHTTHPAAPHLRTGKRGENLAALFLDECGLVVLGRNWRCPEGELDLIATDRRRLIVCEVKTRSSTDFGHPAEAVTDEKANRIRRLSRRWRTAHGIGWCEERFDIISIIWPPGEPPQIHHLQDAF